MSPTDSGYSVADMIQEDLTPPTSNTANQVWHPIWSAVFCAVVSLVAWIGAIALGAWII